MLQLHNAISAVCPIVGVSVPNAEDRTTWRAYFAVEATTEQVAAANSVLATFDLTTAIRSPRVKAEAQRRIIALTGTSSLDACIIKQLNALMRATELTNKKASGATLSPQEEAEAVALEGLAAAIKSIRAKSNEIEAMRPIPEDCTAEGLWQ